MQNLAIAVRLGRFADNKDFNKFITSEQKTEIDKKNDDDNIASDDELASIFGVR